MTGICIAIMILSFVEVGRESV